MEKASSLTVSNSQRNSDLKLHVLDIQCLLSKQNMQKGTQCMEEQAVFIGSEGGKNSSKVSRYRLCGPTHLLWEILVYSKYCWNRREKYILQFPAYIYLNIKTSIVHLLSFYELFPNKDMFYNSSLHSISGLCS